MGAEIGREISSVKKKKILQQFFKGKDFPSPTGSAVLPHCGWGVGCSREGGRKGGMSEEYQECTPRIYVPIMISQGRPSQKIILFIIQGIKYKARKHCFYS